MAVAAWNVLLFGSVLFMCTVPANGQWNRYFCVVSNCWSCVWPSGCPNNYEIHYSANDCRAKCPDYEGNFVENTRNEAFEVQEVKQETQQISAEKVTSIIQVDKAIELLEIARSILHSFLTSERSSHSATNEFSKSRNGSVADIYDNLDANFTDVANKTKEKIEEAVGYLDPARKSSFSLEKTIVSEKEVKQSEDTDKKSEDEETPADINKSINVTNEAAELSELSAEGNQTNSTTTTVFLNMTKMDSAEESFVLSTEIDSLNNESTSSEILSSDGNESFSVIISFPLNQQMFLAKNESTKQDSSEFLNSTEVLNLTENFSLEENATGSNATQSNNSLEDSSEEPYHIRKDRDQMNVEGNSTVQSGNSSALGTIVDYKTYSAEEKLHSLKTKNIV